MTETTTTLALVGIVGSVITALFKLLKDNTKATASLSAAIGSLVDETRKGNREAKQRNGHLAELVIGQGDKTIEAVQTIKKQHVNNQVVDHQEVRK